MYRLPKTFAPIVCGFALLDIWCDLLGHSAATVAAATLVQQSFTNGRVVWNLALVAFCALMVAAPAQLTRARRALDVAFPLVAIPFTLLYGFADGPSATLPLACIVGTAIAYGWLEIRLFCEAAKLDSAAQIVAAVVASRALKAVVAAAIGMLPDAAQVFADGACVLACGACLVLAARWAGSGTGDQEPPKRLAESDRILVIVLVAVYPALNAVARALSPLGFWGDASITGAANFAPVAVGAAVFALVCFGVFRGCSEASVFNRMAAALVVLFGALLVINGVVLPLAEGTPAARGATMGVELFSHSLFWLAGIFAARMVAGPAMRYAAATELVMSSVAVLLSAALQATAGIGQGIVTVALYLVMATFVLVVWRFREQLVEQARRASESSAGRAADAGEIVNANPAAGIDELAATCDRLAADNGLTPRETEVLHLLAEGRSRHYIQEKLVISDATVKTHCKHVYQKLGVANKQELIELVRSR